MRTGRLDTLEPTERRCWLVGRDMSFWVCVSQRVGGRQLAASQTFEPVIVYQCNASLCTEADTIAGEPKVLCYACVRVSKHCTASLPGNSLPCCLADSPLTLRDNNSQDCEEDNGPRRTNRSLSGGSNNTARRGGRERAIKANLWSQRQERLELVWPRTAVKRGCGGVSESPSPVTIVQRGVGSVEGSTCWTTADTDRMARDQKKVAWARQ